MKDILGYKNKRVVVSGCFSGMGEATARTLVELGAEVHGLDYKDTALSLASFTRTDLRDPASISEFSRGERIPGAAYRRIRRRRAGQVIGAPSTSIVPRRRWLPRRRSPGQ